MCMYLRLGTLLAGSEQSYSRKLQTQPKKPQSEKEQIQTLIFFKNFHLFQTLHHILLAVNFNHTPLDRCFRSFYIEFFLK